MLFNEVNSAQMGKTESELCLSSEQESRARAISLPPTNSGQRRSYH